ncbi:hypothetical protein [Polaromonas sp.]|uniref:hypothetical protein n=1 Tax=Polaromonas sp. TaxID=1869339 RepID=UPI003263C460
MANVKGVLTPAVAIVHRGKGRYGVGEVIQLSVTVTPLGALAAVLADGVKWKLKSGVAGRLSLVNTAAGTATLTLGSTGGDMGLEVWSEAALPAKLTTVNIKVVAPNGVIFRKVPGSTIAHVQYAAHAGFIAEADIEPIGVSFANVEVREGKFKAVAAGAFAHENGVEHPFGPWLGIACVPLTGVNHWLANDRVESSHGVARTDAMGAAVLDEQGRPMFGPSSFEWNIPWHYRVVGEIDNGTIFVYMVHKQTVEVTGRVTIKKHTSESCAANYSDPTTGFGLPPNYP